MSSGDPKIEGKVFVTPSRRRWRARHHHSAIYTMYPLGQDVFGRFGGVKSKRVPAERLDGSDKTWKLEETRA